MNYNNNRYNKYKDETILCAFCERQTNIYNINNHINSKRCLMIQKLKYNDIIINEKKFNLLLLIDKMRYNIRNGILNDN